MVGSTVITRKAGEKVSRAEELGYFKFGGSTLLVLFEEGVINFDKDLADNSKGPLETLVRCISHTPPCLTQITDPHQCRFESACQLGTALIFLNSNQICPRTQRTSLRKIWKKPSGALRVVCLAPVSLPR